MTDIPFTGNFSSVTLPRLLMGLHRKRLTGCLSVNAEVVEKKVYFSKGYAIFSSSSFEDDRLGEMLVKSGKITVEQYDRSVELLKKTGKRQGTILVELGYLTPKELFWGVKYQVREIIYSLFSLERADYEFRQEAIPDEVITLKMSMGNLTYEGVKRIDNWTRIRKEMPSTEAVLKLNDDPLSLFQEVEFTQQDKKILSLIDGKRSVKQVVEDSWLNSFEAMKILYVLCSLGIITEKKVEGSGIPLEELFRPASEGMEALKKRVTSFHERLRQGGISNHELLEVSPAASLEEIKKSYYRMAKEFHPDRFYDSDDQAIKDQLSAIFDAITDAYNSLKAAAASMEEPPISLEPLEEKKESQPPPAQKDPALLAGEKAKKGLLSLKAGDIASAVNLLREATGLAPDNPDHWSHLALALSRKAGGFKESEKAMFEAIGLDPANDDLYANLGLLYLRAKLHDKAKTQFEKSLALNPENAKAKQGLKNLGA